MDHNKNKLEKNQFRVLLIYPNGLLMNPPPVSYGIFTALLKEKGYVETVRGVPENKRIPGGDKYTQKMNESAIMYKITAAGRRQARNAVMLKE